MMEITDVVIGSTNPVKVAAATAAIQQIWPQATLTALAVDAGIRAQPLSDDEAILGATNRARQALAATNATLAIGLEGNTHDTLHGMFGTGWAVVLDRAGTVGIGGSGRFLLPAHLAHALRQGEELGPLMDALTSEQNTRQRQGAIGIFTNQLMTRQDALETAVLFALTRFLNPHYYE
jgi:inosine/xanthosine triphosphatase